MREKGEGFKDLEVLVATQNRTSLDFVFQMFPDQDFTGFRVLIVNQTVSGSLLVSDHEKIRVINSFEKGLSKSRNLAMQKASCEIVLISDDDVVYEKEFYKPILKAFNKDVNASFITFKAKDLSGKTYRDYFELSRKHDIKSIRGVISWEIAFNLEKIKSFNLKFNERFGLGSEFPTAEEYLFVRDIIIKQGEGFFCNEFIVFHPEFNSGKALGSDEIVYARGALNYLLFGMKAYFWVAKYMFFLWRKQYIKLIDLPWKIKMAIKGIGDYRKRF